MRVRIAPSTMEILAKRADFVPGQTLPLFELRSPVFEGFDYIVKRAFDLVGAALLMIVLSPVLALSALAVKLTSRGPVFYRSWRPGIGGERFACLKFRTMYVDAERAAGRARAAQRGRRRALQDQGRPARHAGRPLPAPLLARRAAAAVERAQRRDVARRPAAAARSATTTGSRTGTASATSCCRA